MRRIFLSLTAAGITCAALWAQASRAPEPLSAWLYFKEIQVSAAGGGLRDFELDREMLDRSRADHADVRLYKGASEIPYVLRVRRVVATQEAFTVRQFNRSASDGVSQVSCDLGEAAVEHNEVEIQTAGNNFRRSAEVEGSTDGAQWSTLVSGALLFRFTATGRMVEQQDVTYPVSRYRYLRIRVSRDPQVDHTPPEMGGIQIRRTVHRQGEMLSFPVNLQGREPDRLNSRATSVWRMDLGGRIPFERIVITASEGAYARPFQMEAIDDPTAPAMFASGELVKREDGASPGAIEFPERVGRRLKLTVTDDRNAPLSITDVTALSAARQVVFETPAAVSGPIRVYYGNQKAVMPHYDVAVRLSEDLNLTPARLALGEQKENPIYSPEALPFSERSPWLVYVVLGAAALALCAILLSLVRMSRSAAARSETEASLS
jgi:hypothetical protein